MPSTVVVPDRAHNQIPDEMLQRLIEVATAAKADIDTILGTGGASPALRARGVVDANVANLAAFTVAAPDGITYAAGDTVLLTKQTTAAENGLYVVGAVGGGTAALSRPAYWQTGVLIPLGTRVVIGPEGTLYKNTEWFATSAKTAVIGTNDPAFYPLHIKVKATLVLGTVTLGAAEGVWLKSTTESKVQITRNTANTTTLTTGGYAAPEASRTAGIVGTAAIIINAEKADGTLNNADVSTLDVDIFN